MSSRIPLVPENTAPLPSLKENNGLLSWVASVDHKQIGIMYIVTSLFFFLLADISEGCRKYQISVGFHLQNHYFCD